MTDPHNICDPETIGEQETETLVGGLCDGLRIMKSDAKIQYAGIKGDGFINVYVRDGSGVLRFNSRICLKKDHA